MKKSLIVLFSAAFLMGGISLAGNYTSEQKSAYDYAYSQKITTASSIENADMDGELTRIAMAKMISNFAINVLGLQLDTSLNCSFGDVASSLDEQYNYGVTQACQLGLMGMGKDGKKSENFDPNATVTRAQFATAFSRALSKLNGNIIEDGDPYYSTHLQYLQSEGIIKSVTSPSPSTAEKRGNVMIMMQRSSNGDKVRENSEIKGNPEYYYQNLDITANVGLDGKIDVLENFIAYFNVEKHGIIRSISLSNISVSDIDVKGQKFTTYTENGNINIKIGDADKTIKGFQTYPISYKVNGLIKEYSKHTELYWDLVGYGFDTNINSVKAEIILPKTYTGFTKDDFLITTDGKSITIDGFKGIVDWSKGDRIIIIYDKGLSAYEGITLAVRFPVDYFEFTDNQYDGIGDVSGDGEQSQKLSAEIIANLKDKGVVRGSEDAKITIIEFTELLCPYCQRHSQQGTINSVIQQFSGQVNSISRPFIIHGDIALQLSSALECVGELNSGVYYDVLDESFGVYPVNLTGLVNIAVEHGVDEKLLGNCINEGKNIQSIVDKMNIGLQLGVNGTPGSIIINNESGKYVIVAGAYPVETFVEAVESLL